MNFLSKIIFHLLFLTCLILPFSFQISTIGAISVCVLVLVHAFIHEKGLNIRTNFLFLELPIILFIIPFVGLLYTSFIPQTIDLLIKYLPYLIFSIAFFFAQNDIKKSSREYVQFGVIAGVTMVLFYLFGSLFMNVDIESVDSFKELFSYKSTYRNFTKPLDTHTSYLGLLVLMSNIFIFKSSFKLRYRIVLLAINFFGIIFIASKIILFLYALQLFSLFFFFKKRKIIILLVVGFLASTSVLVYLYNNNLRDVYFLQRITREIVWDFDSSNVGTRVNGKVEDDSRVARWKAIWEESKKKIIFGHGTGSETTMLKVIHANNNLLESIKRKYNTHNQYLFYFLESGFFGVILCLLFLGSNLKYVMRTKDFSFFFFLFSCVLICLVENYFNRTMGVLTVSLFSTFLKKNND